MTTDLTKQQHRPGDLAKPADMLYLLHIETGRILPWTPILAVKPGMVDCDAVGNPINPQNVAGDDPYIIQETKNLAERMKIAGADANTLSDFGRHLTEQGEKKFRQLAYENAKARQLEHKPKTSQVDYSHDPSMARIETKINRRAQEALEEIGDMALAYLHKLAGMTARLTPGWRREVSEVVVRRRVMENIKAPPVRICE